MSLSLRQQGMVAISSLLFLELLFVGCHFLLLQQAEEAASTRQRTRESMDRASQLLQNLYTAGDRVGSYGLYKREQDLKAYLDAKSKCQETMSWLKQNVHGQPEQVERVQSMDENIKLGFSVLDKMKRSAENGNSAEATKFSVEQKLRLQPRIEELVDSLRDFMSTQRVIEEKSPEIRRQNRGATFVLLIAASISNIVLAFAIGFLFSRSITSRLKVLIDNSHLLEQGQPLRAPLEGDDEIARLDNAFHDMSSSLRGEEALLRASQRAVISLIAQMPAGVLMIDDKGSIELSNDSMIDMLSYASEDMPGKSFSDLIVSAFESDRTLIASLLQTDKGHVAELHARRKDGTTFPVEVALANFSDGDKDRYLSIIMDVSAKQEMQNLKKTFVAMVSHELRTPLTHVFGYLDLLKMGIYGPVTSLAETAMEESIEKTQQLTNLINDLLDMEKLDAGMFDIVKEKCELEDIIDDAVDSVSSMVERANIDIFFEGCEIALIADRECLTQSLLRLLICAMQLSPSGGCVRLSTQETKSDSEILVQMPGVLIAEEQIPVIFDRFQQMDSPFKQGGIGLGLALSRAIIEQHEGEVGVRSSADGGTCFFMKLPKKV